MSISNALNNALSGLSANGRLADVTAGNLANALTPGYGRQTVNLASAVTGAQGTGVRVDSVSRQLDPALSAERRGADGTLAQRTAVSDGLLRLERAFGQVGEPGGLYGRLEAFEIALRQLGDTPESAPRQVATADAARDLAQSFNTIAAETLAVREAADRDIARAVEETNANLAAFADINRRIQVATAAGRETAALIDRREGLIDRVAQVVPVRQTLRDDGVVELRTAEGIGLADIRAQQLTYSRQIAYQPGLEFADGAGTLSGITLQGIDVTPGGQGSQAIKGGALAGLFALRDEVAPQFERQLDSLAADLIARTADPAVDPTIAPGTAGLFTDRGAAFDPVDTVGIAYRIELNAVVDPQAGGDPARLRDGLYAAGAAPTSDPTLVRALADALSDRRDASATPGVTGLLSLSDRMARVSESVATGRVSAEGEVATISAARDVLAAQESARVGVDTDAELSRLVQIEQAYAANAQVIQTAARMLDELQRIR